MKLALIIFLTLVLYGCEKKPAPYCMKWQGEKLDCAPGCAARGQTKDGEPLGCFPPAE